MDKLVNYLCIIQARLNSSRLPAKVMLDLGGKTLLERVYETVNLSNCIDKTIIATSINSTDDPIALKAEDMNIEVFRGSLENVLERFYLAGKKYQAKNIVRITADNPLMDGKVIDSLINIYEEKKVDYSMFLNGVYGLSAEVFSFESLKLAYENSRNQYDKEHVTPFIRENSNMYNVDISLKYAFPEIRATIDTLDDYIEMELFYLDCQKNGVIPTIDTYIERVKNQT